MFLNSNPGISLFVGPCLDSVAFFLNSSIIRKSWIIISIM